MIQGAYIVGNEDFTYEKFFNLERKLNVIFPEEYKKFIIEMKGAEIDYEFVDDFKKQHGFLPIIIFSNGEAEARVRFDEADIFFDLENHSVFSKDYGLPKKLITFADEGAGRYFCFDFDKAKDGEVPIILLMPDAKEEIRGLYIADDFEQFLEMIGNPKIEASCHYVPYYDVEEE